MNRVIAMGLFLVLPTLASCQKGAVTEGPPENFYFSILKTYVAQIDQNKEDSDRLRYSVSEFVAELQSAQYEDLGAHKGTVDQMITAAGELSTLLKDEASPEEIAAKIQQLSSAANSLPGEVDASQLEPPDEEE